MPAPEALAVRRQQVEERVARRRRGDRRRALDEEEDDDRRGPDVRGGAVVRERLAALERPEDLGREVGGGAAGVRQRLARAGREAEVRDDQSRGRVAQQEVLGLQVAVDDAAVVAVRDGREELGRVGRGDLRKPDASAPPRPGRHPVAAAAPRPCRARVHGAAATPPASFGAGVFTASSNAPVSERKSKSSASACSRARPFSKTPRRRTTWAWPARAVDYHRAAFLKACVQEHARSALQSTAEFFKGMCSGTRPLRAPKYGRGRSEVWVPRGSRTPDRRERLSLLGEAVAVALLQRRGPAARAAAEKDARELAAACGSLRLVASAAIGFRRAETRSVFTARKGSQSIRAMRAAAAPPVSHVSGFRLPLRSSEIVFGRPRPRGLSPASRLTALRPARAAAAPRPRALRLIPRRAKTESGADDERPDVRGRVGGVVAARRARYGSCADLVVVAAEIAGYGVESHLLLALRLNDAGEWRAVPSGSLCCSREKFRWHVPYSFLPIRAAS